MSDTTEIKTLSEIGLDYPHHKVHNEQSFEVSDVNDLTNAATFDYLIITPNTIAWAHFVMLIQSERECSYQIFENPTITNATITAGTIAFVDSNPDTITDSGSGFVAAGFTAGPITVVGSASNDANYTIDAGGVAAGTLTLVAGDALSAEGTGATVTITEGNAMTAYNRNRNSSAAPTVVIANTPTVGATGTTIIIEEHWDQRISGITKVGNRGLQEFILKRNEEYLIRITNETALNNQVSVILNWYEHTAFVIGDKRS